MSSFDIKNLIVQGVNSAITRPFVEAQQAHKKPVYPYATFQVLTAHSNEYEHDNIKTENVASSNPSFTYDVRKSKIEQPQMILSINAYSKISASDTTDNSIQEAVELAQEIKDWLDFKGDLYLEQNNITVVESEDILQRDVFIVDQYERRYGFDVRIRYDESIDVTIESIEQVTL